jgi:hypothetical protein
MGVLNPDPFVSSEVETRFSTSLEANGGEKF